MRIIDLNVCLAWPWGKFKHLGSWSRKLSKHKVWELEHYYAGSLLDLSLHVTAQQDHAGFEITAGILGYGIRATVYDVRHWDCNKNCYN
jgi:hypothetical protein